MRKYPSGTIYRHPLPNTQKLQVIVKWNTNGRNCLNAFNNNCPKELAKEIPEAEWEIKCI
jgi:hypothetical protein